MTLAAVLCWYDEPVEFLERCIRSLAGVCDYLVAVDGAWNPFPAGKPRSPVDQINAINRVSNEIGIPGTMTLTDAVWPSQIDKRSVACQETVTKSGCDWLLSIDGDEWVAHCDRQSLTARLAATSRHVAQVSHRNVTGDDHRNVSLPLRRIYRAHPHLTVSETHQGYRIGDIHLDGDTTIPNPPRLEPPEDLTDLLTIHHTPRSRSEKRNAAARTYRHARAATRER